MSNFTELSYAQYFYLILASPTSREWNVVGKSYILYVGHVDAHSEAECDQVDVSYRPVNSILIRILWP